MADRQLHLRNPNVKDDKEDILYHLGLTYHPSDPYLAEQFHDVRYVLMGGSAERAKRFALRTARELGMEPPTGYGLRAIGKQERFSIYKIGPVLSVSHGMGIPSISILLHEVTKLLHHAKTRDFCYLRVGTCGGLGVEPGTVVISDKAVNEKVEACDEVWSLGKCKRNPALFDPTLAEELAAQAAGHRVSSPAIAEELRARDRRRRDEGLDYMSGEGHSFSRDDGRAIPAQRGTTMAASGFYEQQGRIDGAICDHTAEEKMQWLQSLHDAGVRNIEMEGTKLAGFCHATGIPACMLCTVLVDRLKGDQVILKPEELVAIASNAQRLVLRFIKARRRAQEQGSAATTA